MTTTEIPHLPPVEDARQGPEDDALISVTSIIGVLDKPALLYWARNEVAKAAIDGHQIWRSRLEHEGYDAALQWLKDAPYRAAKGRRSATQLGTDVHELCEQYVLTGQRPETDAETGPFVDQWERFNAEFRPTFVATELTVYSPRYGYAGTLDAIVEFGGRRFVLDYKTSRDAYDGRGKPKEPYPEVALQEAAYRYAEMAAVWRARRTEKMKRRVYLLSPEEAEMAVPVPETDGGLAVLLTPVSYSVHKVHCDESVFRRFLFIQEAAQWPEMAKTVVEPALAAPYPRVAESDDPFRGLPRD